MIRDPDSSEPTMLFLRLPPSVSSAIGGARGVVEAIAAAPKWHGIPGVVLAAHAKDPKLLGVIGRFDTVARARIDGLQAQLLHALPRLTYLDHPMVEQAVVVLASTLQARFGTEAIRCARFEGIPRGGHIVLGMLSYALGLATSDIAQPIPDSRRRVLVDDCIVSGRRIRRALDALDARSGTVSVAALVASPEAREAIERDPRVGSCVSAYDLRDAAPSRTRPHYACWRARWRARQGSEAYWIGMPNHVCFPWNEPDMAVWNEVTGIEERGWPLVPPSACFKHRFSSVTDRPTLQWQREARGALQPVEDAIACTFEGRLMVGSPTWGECLTLEGVAADVWWALIDHGDVETATTEIATRYDADVRRVGRDVAAVVEHLVVRGAVRLYDDALPHQYG